MVRAPKKRYREFTIEKTGGIENQPLRVGRKLASEDERFCEIKFLGRLIVVRHRKFRHPFPQQINYPVRIANSAGEF